MNRRSFLQLDQLVDRVSVVPATLSTTTRCSPARWLSSVDLPTLGCPTIAMRRGPRDLGLPLGRWLRKGCDRGVEHVAHAAPVKRGDGVGLAEPGAKFLGRKRGLAPLVVDLVGGKHDRLAVRAQEVTTPRRVGQPHGRVDDEEDGVAARTSRSPPGRDALGRGRRRRLPAAGVDEAEGTAVPPASATPAVAGDPGYVLDDRLRRPMMRLNSVDLPTFGRPTTARTGTGPVTSTAVSVTGASYPSLMMLLVR